MNSIDLAHEHSLVNQPVCYILMLCGIRSSISHLRIGCIFSWCYLASFMLDLAFCKLVSVKSSFLRWSKISIIAQRSSITLCKSGIWLRALGFLQSMAGVVDRLRKRNKQQGREWTNTGSFISKPARGWLHPDEQLAPDAGVCYGVRVSAQFLTLASLVYVSHSLVNQLNQAHINLGLRKSVSHLAEWRGEPQWCIPYQP